MDSRASKSGVGEIDYRNTLFGSSSLPASNTTKNRSKYSELKHDDEETDAFLSETIRQQQQVMGQQDETLEKIGASVGVLKNMSEKIGVEVGEHLVIMEDMSNQMERTETRMSRVMSKLQKVSRLSDDRSQWIAIGILLVLLLIVLILFAVL